MFTCPLFSFVFMFLACGGRGTERYYRPQAAVFKSFLPICAKYLFIAVFLRRGAGVRWKLRYKVLPKVLNKQAVNLLYFNYFWRTFAPVFRDRLRCSGGFS